MNNIFDFKRFGNYFAYDLRRAGNNYGISLLVLGLMPVILFIIHLLTMLLRGGNVYTMPSESKIIVLSIVLFVTAVSAGVKIYGSITDKRTGSDFLMLPASTTEKWLSMVLMVCIVVPVALLVLTLASDALLNWLAPSIYGDGIINSDLASDLASITGDEDVSVNMPAILFLGWCGCALTFTLGGIFFKKAKVAKTFLFLFVLSTVLSILAIVAAKLGLGDSISKFVDDINDPASAIDAFNWTLNIFNIITLGGLLVLTWFRLRTLKH